MADLTKLTDREMLEKLEWAGHKADATGMSYMNCCPVCLQEDRHAADCKLYNHLHPEFAVGSPEWAEAQGKAGENIQGKGWDSKTYWVWHDSQWWNNYGEGFSDIAFHSVADWQLYEPSKSKPPKRVRWRLEWAGDSWDGDEVQSRVLRVTSDSSEDGIFAYNLPNLEEGGYRFNAWVYNLPTGYEMRCPAGKIPMYWDETQEVCADIPGGGLIPIWPQEVEMIRVEDAE